jgi:multiple sugar transport system permease protein
MTSTTFNAEQQAARDARNARLRFYGSRIFTYLLMSFIGFIFLFPIIFMIVAAFKPNERVLSDLATIQAFLPDFTNLTLDNIINVFDRVAFERYAFNSIFITVTTVLVGLFVNSMAAFVLSRMRWPGRNVALALIVSLIILPLEAIAAPLLMQVNEMSFLANVAVLLIITGVTFGFWIALTSGLDGALSRLPFYWHMETSAQRAMRGILAAVLSLPFLILVGFMVQQMLQGGTWLNTYHVQILPFIAEPLSIFLFYQFFINIPKDFDEAAYVDGAGAFRIYWQLIVPISRPVFATVAILKFLQFYSFYLWPLMVTRSDDYRPLMVGMDFFQTQEPILWGSIMAYAAMVTIPVLIVFLLFQRWFVQSVSSSGVKG